MPAPHKKRPRGRPPNAERADRSRRAILDAAVPIFAERGYATSLNEIIRASGLTKGGFYFHFPSKGALALAVIDDYQRRWAGQVMAEAARYVRAIDRVFTVPRNLAGSPSRARGRQGFGD
jgi:AcrR family transcriptional regulator